MDIKIMTKGKIHDLDHDGIYGTYHFDSDLATIHVGRLWKKANTTRKFIPRFAKSMSHETLHRAVIKELNRDKSLDLGCLYLARNEYIVRKMLNERMNPFSLASYIMNDTLNDFSTEMYQNAMKGLTRQARFWRNVYYTTIIGWGIFFVIHIVKLVISR